MQLLIKEAKRVGCECDNELLRHIDYNKLDELITKIKDIQPKRPRRSNSHSVRQEQVTFCKNKKSIIMDFDNKSDQKCKKNVETRDGET